MDSSHINSVSFISKARDLCGKSHVIRRSASSMLLVRYEARHRKTSGGEPAAAW